MCDINVCIKGRSYEAISGAIMEKLKVRVNGKEISLFYTVRYKKGIFCNEDNKAGKRNCELLNISFDADPRFESIVHTKVIKYDKFVFLTVMVSAKYLQFIVMNYTEKDDMDDLLKEYYDKPDMQTLLITAYNAISLGTTGEIDLSEGGMAEWK